MKPETQVFYPSYTISNPSLTATFRSPIRRIHPSEHQALLDAQRHRSRSLRRRKLRSWRAGEESKVKETVYSELASRRNGSHHQEAESVLAGLSSGPGTCSLCGAWVCTVSLCLRAGSLVSGDYRPDVAVADVGRLDTTASLSSINTTTLTSPTSKV